MVYKCCVSSCRMSVRVAGSKGLSYHTFPTKESHRDKWVQAILPYVDKPEVFRIVQGYTRVCSRHFKKKDYSIDSKRRARLSSNAVPSVFPGREVSESSLSTKIENAAVVDAKIRSEFSKKSSSATISPQDRISTLTLTKGASGNYKILGEIATSQIGTVEPLSIFDSASTIHDAQSQALSEDDTASSTFSSQEECYTNLPQQHASKANGKIRKRRKNRASLPITSNSSKKRSSTSEDLNIEGVGDALAEINLSAFMTGSSELNQGLKGVRKLSLAKDDGVEDTPKAPVKEDKSRQLRPEQPPASVSYLPKTTNSMPLESLSLTSFMAEDQQEDYSLPGQMHDLYAELVNGGASLSLEDSSLTIFDSQVLIDALRSVTEDLETGSSIDQLAHDLNCSLLDGALPTSILDIDDFHISDLVPSIEFEREERIHPVQSSENKTQTRALLTDQIVNQKPMIRTDVNVAKQKESPNAEETPKKRKEESVVAEDSSPEFEENSTVKSRKKSTRKEKIPGSFSVERFCDSDKDIEYYTGFQTYEKFDAFFRSIDSYVENLRVTDMMHGVANIGQAGAGTQDCLGISTKICGDLSLEDAGIPPQEEQKRRLSQGRAMSRFDELFMTIIRLKRKIPEKVIGHMFCISQPSVSRIIRAWTMLLSKILELLPVEEKTSTSTVRSTLSGNNTSDDTLFTPGEESTISKKEVKIPCSFRQLFQSDLAQNIIASGNAFTNSRKTSSSTSCSNISRSKRPKKEKLIIVVTEQLSPAVTSPIKEGVNSKKIVSDSTSSSVRLKISKKCSGDGSTSEN